MRYRDITEKPWAILEDRSLLEGIADIAALEAAGATLTPNQVMARLGMEARDQQQDPSRGAIAVLPVWGVISHRLDLFWGGTSSGLLAARIRQLAGDPSIQAIVLDIDSPGGMVEGVPELWATIYKAREQKPIIAVANGMAASAAYYIASAASEVVVIPSGQVGSIGVLLIHLELSKAFEESGWKFTVMRAGKYKAEGNPFEPLTDEAKEYMQKLLDGAYADFLRDVAKGRDVKVSDVRSSFGQGRMVTAKEAKEIGMVDRIATLDEVLMKLTKGRERAKPVRAQAPELSMASERAGSYSSDEETYEDILKKWREKWSSGTARWVIDPDVHEKLLKMAQEDSLVIQTLIFPKEKWDSLAAVKKWAKDHDYRTDKVDETDDSWRLRQREPDDFKEGTFRTFCINPSRDTKLEDCKVKAVGGKLKSGAKAGAIDRLRLKWKWRDRAQRLT